MALSLRPTGLSSPPIKDKLDYIVGDDGETIGRIYEDRHAPPDVRWLWSITIHVDPALGIITNGRVPTLDSAKEWFKASWSRVVETRRQKEQQRP